jgi:AcrR family transcriptional regulator
VRTVDPARIERIIDAAAQLFAERHYHEVRMDDIAAKANVAKGTIYLHFKDKDDLYRALAVNSFRKLIQNVRDALVGVDDPASKLLNFHRVIIHFFEHNAFTLDLINRVERLKQQSEIDNKPLNECRDDFTSISRSIMEEFREATHKTDIDISLAVVAHSGMIKQVVQELPTPWPADLPERLTSLFLQGFTHTKTPEPARLP